MVTSYPLVLVDWMDSYGCSASWQNLEPISPTLMVCHSVGWLVHDGEDCKVIVPHIADSEPASHRQGCGDMTIPTKAILRIRSVGIGTYRLGRRTKEPLFGRSYVTEIVRPEGGPACYVEDDDLARKWIRRLNDSLYMECPRCTPSA